MAVRRPKAEAPPRREPSEATISIRIAPKTRDLIDRAAALLGKSRTEFVLDSARREAADVLLDQRLFDLSAADGKALAAALDRPPPASDALRALFAAKAPWER